MVTRNSADRLAHCLTLALEFADELVVMVDESSTDDTLAIARRYADKVMVVEHPASSEETLDWLFRQASGEWIVRLDDDEFFSRDFTRSVPILVADRHFTHYFIPRRWVVNAEGGGYEWLTEFPWRPEASLRMVRNIGGLFWHPGGTHQPVRVGGEGRVLRDDEGVMYHMDLAWRSREQREAKVFQYYAPVSVVTGEHMYLYETEPSSNRRAPVPAGEIGRQPNEIARSRAAQREARPRPSPYARKDPSVPLGRMLLSTAQWQRDPPVFSAEYLDCSLPEGLQAGCGYAATLTLRNTSAARWPGPGGGLRLGLGSHWRTPAGGIVEWDGNRVLVPRPVAPGETCVVEVGFYAPPTPGSYLLEFDLVVEEVDWFSARGVAPHQVAVEVLERPLVTPAGGAAGP